MAAYDVRAYIKFASKYPQPTSSNLIAIPLFVSKVPSQIPGSRPRHIPMEGDSKENPLVMSDDKIEVLPSSDDSYHMRPIANSQVGPTSSGQRAVHSTPWEYGGAGEQQKKEKSKVEAMEPVKGTWATRRYCALNYLNKSFLDLHSSVMVSKEEGSKKENHSERDVGEGFSRGLLVPIEPVRVPDPSPLPILPPIKKLSFGKVTEDLSYQFQECREWFLVGHGVPWLERQFEGSLPSYAGGRGIGVIMVDVLPIFFQHYIFFSCNFSTKRKTRQTKHNTLYTVSHIGMTYH